MEHLNPVGQMCLGLTSSFFHQVLHSIYGTGEEYNIKKNPFDVRMRFSVCGEWAENYTWFDLGLWEDPDIIWEPCLGYLLSEEKTLWGNLIWCNHCLTFKPERAYERFAYEEHMFLKHEKAIKAYDAEDVLWYMSVCSRCRAKTLLLHFKRRKEFWENPPFHRDWESLGLQLQRPEFNGEVRLERIKAARTDEQFHAARNGYEDWGSIFRRLGI